MIVQVTGQYEKLYNQVSEYLNSAVKDNEMLYFMKEPDYKELAKIEPEILAKSMEIDYNDVKTTAT